MFILSLDTTWEFLSENYLSIQPDYLRQDKPLLDRWMPRI